MDVPAVVGYSPNESSDTQSHHRNRSQVPTSRGNRVEAPVAYAGESRRGSSRMESTAAAAATAGATRGSESARRRNHTKSIGHYILGKTIGEGTFGKVKLGTHILTGEKVAVKVLEKERIVDVADVERVAREVYILKLIRHQHVVQLYEIIETSRQLYLIMEYASGGELFDYIVASGRIQEPEACRFFRQILDGVEEIHKMNVVHRDLKPENLLLDEHRHIKIVDFGLSNTYRNDQLLKTACGSPCYAAPEMIAGKEYVPSLCDIWSCGVILFAMLCGYLPFEDQNTAALYRKILAAEYALPDFLSGGARDMIQGMLTTDPTRRMTAAVLRQQSWFNSVPDDLTGIRSQPRFAFEEDILEELEKFGFPPDYTQRCLHLNKHNHVTTTYHLLERKKQRMMDQVLVDQMSQDCAFDQASGGASLRIGGYDGREFIGDMQGQAEDAALNSARGHPNDGSGSARTQHRSSYSARGGSSPTRGGNSVSTAWAHGSQQSRDSRDPRHAGTIYAPQSDNSGNPPSPRNSARGQGATASQQVQARWATRTGPPSTNIGSPTPTTSAYRSESPMQGGSPGAPTRRPRSEITTPRGPRRPSADRLQVKSHGSDNPTSTVSPAWDQRSDRGDRERTSVEERSSPGTPKTGVGQASAPITSEGGPKSTRNSFGASGASVGSAGVTASASSGSRTTGTGVGSPGPSVGNVRSGRLPSPPRSNKNTSAVGQPPSARPLTSPTHSTTGPSSARGSFPPSSARGGSHSLSSRAAYSMSARSQTPDTNSRHQTPSRNSTAARATSKTCPHPGVSLQQTQPNGGVPSQSASQSGVSSSTPQQPIASPQQTTSSQPSTPGTSFQPPGTPPMVSPAALQPQQQQSSSLSAQANASSSTAAALAALRARRPFAQGELTTPRSETNTPRGQIPSAVTASSGSSSARGPQISSFAQPQAATQQNVPRWPERPLGNGMTTGTSVNSEPGRSDPSRGATIADRSSALGDPGRGLAVGERQPTIADPGRGPQISERHPSVGERPLSSRVAPTTDFDATLQTTFAPLSARSAGEANAAPLSSREAREDRRAALDTLRTSSRPPRLIMQELQRVLAAQRVASKQINSLTLRCQWLSLKFDVEVAPLDRLGSIHAVRARRTAGEPWQYKDVCNRLLAELRIA